MKNSELIIVKNSPNIQNEKPIKSQDEPYLVTILIIIAFAILFAVYKLYSSKRNTIKVVKTTPQSHLSTVLSTPSTPAQTPVPIPDFKSLELQLRELASKAWTTEASFQYSPFVMNPSDFTHVMEPVKFVELLLHQARNTVPGFQVPYMAPRVLIEAIPFAAGQFHVDEDGWVSIKVGSDFFEDKLAAKAILAHEVCHYILENSGIRKSDFLLNERYTDMCMFICGFGQIFLAGYKQKMAQNEYRSGHRLGYLTDAEYEDASRYVMQLRQSNELAPSSELDALKKRMLQLVYDKETCKRMIEAACRRYPHKSEIELYRDEIDRLERDRR